MVHPTQSIALERIRPEIFASPGSRAEERPSCCKKFEGWPSA